MKNNKLIYKIFVFFTIVVLILLTVAPVFSYLNRQKAYQAQNPQEPLDLQVESVETDKGTLDIGGTDATNQ